MKRGITLVSLVITIVIMLILAGVGIYGSIALIEEAKYSAFINEMQQIDEAVALLIMEKQLEATETEEGIVLFSDKVQDINDLPESVQNEIKYIRAKLENENISAMLPINYTNTTLETGEGKDIYYVDEETAGGKERTYIYMMNKVQVYTK